MPLFGSLGGFRKIMGKLIGNDTPTDNQVLTFDSASDTWLAEDGGSSSLTFADIGAKKPVRVATLQNGTLSTDFENGDTIDGVTLSTGDRILIKDQTTASENGIYTVNASGAPTRATDYDADAEVLGGQLIQVLEGDFNQGNAFTLVNTGAITVGTTDLVFINTIAEKSVMVKHLRMKYPGIKPLTLFPSGHGWVLAGTPGGTLVDTTTAGEFITGTQALKLTIPASNTTNHDVENFAISPTWDTRQRYIGILFKIDSVEELNERRIHIGQDTSNLWQPTLQAQDQWINDSWFMQIVDLSQETATGSPTRNNIDFLRFRWSLQAGAAQHVYLIDSIWTFPYPPTGSVLFRFDDSPDSHRFFAVPKLGEYGYHGSFYIIPYNLGAANSLTIEQCREMQDLGHDICSHDSVQWSTLGNEALRKRLIDIKSAMAQMGFWGLDHTVYPGGAILRTDKTWMDVIRQYFITAQLNVSEPESNPPTDPLRISVLTINASTTQATITDYIDDNMTNGGLAVVMIHRIVASGATGNEVNQAVFDAVVDHCNTNSYPVRSITEYLKNLDNLNTLDEAGIIKVTKKVEQTVNNSTTLVDDDELFFFAEANKMYRVRVLLYFDSTAVANFKYQFTIPSGASFRRNNGTWSSTAVTTSQNIATPNTITSAGNQQFIEIDAVLTMGATAGTVQLQWAQDTAEATATDVRRQSMIEAWRN